MTTSMDSWVTELSKQIGDHFEGTADTNATNPTYTLVDTALAEKLDEWVGSEASGEAPSWLYIVSASGAAPEGEERLILSHDQDTYTMLVNSDYPFSASIDNGDTYEVHRMFSRGEKEKAIAMAHKRCFPHVYKVIKDRSIVFGDWLVNAGNFPKWSQTTHPDSWTVDTATVSKNTTTSYVLGLPPQSLKFDSAGAAGSIYQDMSTNSDLWRLAGKTVYFYAWAYSTGATEVRLGIYDGTTNYLSDYHTGGSKWELLSTSGTISPDTTTVQFKIYYTTGSANAYVCSVHLIAQGKYEYVISHLGLYNNTPNQIFLLHGANVSDETPEPKPAKTRIDEWDIQPNGTLLFDADYKTGRKFEIQGMAYLTVPVSVYAGGTETSSEVDDIDVEGQIIIAEAAKYLYETKMNTAPVQDRKFYKAQADYWINQCRERRMDYAMPAIAPTRI